MPKTLLAQETAIFDAELLDKSGKIPREEPEAVRYQPMRCRVSTSPMERKTYAWRRAGFLAACINTDTDAYFMATLKKESFIGLLALHSRSNKSLFLE